MKNLSRNAKGEFIEAILAYAFEQKEPEKLSPEIRPMFCIVKPQMHLNYCSDIGINQAISNLLNDDSDEV